ncbi:hypothetical protein H6P81_019110 [Aristolochia fimbriata]|uniref:RNase H type-1 domain-containing protein n=1 Tax=Aristolochia fimbriata TaxID=158543 RepID=A0AAV7DQV4_ARIFI|nr:hypothetical protein H6P81_019110 [Aristolochia fimbriata]
MPKSFDQFLQQWYPCPLPSCGRLLRRTTIAAVSWHLWLERNARTFNNQRSTLGGVIEKSIHSILLWASTSQKLPPFPSSEIRKHWAKVIDFHSCKMPKMVEWKTPQRDGLKMNFDGSSLGNSGPEGIGGAIKNSVGVSLLVFSGPCSSNEAEARALLMGLKLLKQQPRGKYLTSSNSPIRNSTFLGEKNITRQQNAAGAKLFKRITGIESSESTCRFEKLETPLTSTQKLEAPVMAPRSSGGDDEHLQSSEFPFRVKSSGADPDRIRINSNLARD